MHLWHLIVFTYHQLRALGRPRDALFHQQQAILRTLPAPSLLFTDSIKLWWQWRKRTNDVLYRTLAQATLALLCTIGTLAVSISSSFIVDSTNIEVLVNSPFCGSIAESNIYTAQINDVTPPFLRDCYRDGASPVSRCRNIFTKQNIPVESGRVDCPFSAEMCINTNDNQKPAFSVDSGLLDLNDAFGFNFAPSDRVKFRRRSTCAVLPREGHVTVMNATDIPKSYKSEVADLPGERYELYAYGTRPNMGNMSRYLTSMSLVKSDMTKKYNRWYACL